MFTRSHARAIRAAATIALALASAALLAGCATASQSSQPNTPTPVFVAKPAAPPVLNLCADPSHPPDAISSKPGYTQMGVIVADPSGQPISGLEQADFRVTLGSRIVPVDFFHSDSAETPKSIVLVVDTSTDIRGKSAEVASALDELLMPSGSCDEFAAFGFGTRPYLVRGFSTDHRSTDLVVTTLPTAGATAMYDAIIAASNYAERNAHYTNRALVVFTNRMDDCSIARQQDVIESVKQSGIRAFLVAIGDPDAAPRKPFKFGTLVLGDADINRPDARALRKFAAATGGQVFIVNKSKPFDLGGAVFPVEPVVTKIRRLLDDEYSIGVSLPAGASASKLRISVSSRPGAVVSARLAPPRPGVTAQQAHSARHS